MEITGATNGTGFSSLSHSGFVILALSHKRNSKGFDRQNRRAATSSHDEIPHTNVSWADNRSRAEHERIGANDDQRRGRDLSVADLLEMV